MNPLKITKLGTIGAVAALLAMSGATAEAQQQQVFTRVGKAPQAAQTALAAEAAAAGDGERRVKMVRTDDNGRNVVVELRNGELITATVDGKRIPSERVIIKDHVVEVLDTDNVVLFEMATPPVPPAPPAPGAPTMYRFQGSELPQLRTFTGTMGDGGAWVFGEPAEAPKVMLGVSLADPDRSLRQHFDLEPGQATMLLSVYDGLPAAEAGLEAYDLVIDVDGKSAGPADLRAALQDAEPGDTLKLTVIQAGKRKNVTVRLEAHDAKKLEAAAKAYREKMAAEGEEMGFFEFNIPAPPAPPALPGARGQGGADAKRQAELFESHRRDAEVYRRLRSDQELEVGEARRRAEELMRDAQSRQRQAEVQIRGQAGSQQQLERLENRMERLERLLERLAEDRESQRRGGGD